MSAVDWPSNHDIDLAHGTLVRNFTDVVGIDDWAAGQLYTLLRVAYRGGMEKALEMAAQVITNNHQAATP